MSDHILTPKQIRLLRRVKRLILAEPRRYEQGTWGSQDAIAPCGTAACIAGHIDILSQRARPTNAFLAGWGTRLWRSSGVTMLRRVKAASGITRTSWLFSDLPKLDWPSPLNEQWRKTLTIVNVAKRRTAQAAIAAQAIELYIKQHSAGSR